MPKTVACLAGDGVGPELMAAATRALDRVAALHQFELDDRHLPFAGEGVTRSGHPLPPETRAGYRDVDAILVASPDEPAFSGVMADLQLAWRVVRVHVDPTHDVVVSGPVGEWANETAVGRAFSCAASRRGIIVTVGGSEAWRQAVAAERARWDGLEVEEATLGEALVRLRDDPTSLDVIVTEAHLVDGLVDAAAAFADSQAWSRTPGSGRRPRRLRARPHRTRRRRGLRGRGSDRDAAHDVADARRGPEASLGVAHARACGR